MLTPVLSTFVCVHTHAFCLSVSVAWCMGVCSGFLFCFATALGAYLSKNAVRHYINDLFLLLY